MDPLEMEYTPVTICGGGPTGLVMAIALAKYGISVHEAFEKDS